MNDKKVAVTRNKDQSLGGWPPGSSKSLRIVSLQNLIVDTETFRRDENYDKREKSSDANQHIFIEYDQMRFTFHHIPPEVYTFLYSVLQCLDLIVEEAFILLGEKIITLDMKSS